MSCGSAIPIRQIRHGARAPLLRGCPCVRALASRRPLGASAEMISFTDYARRRRARELHVRTAPAARTRTMDRRGRRQRGRRPRRRAGECERTDYRFPLAIISGQREGPRCFGALQADGRQGRTARAALRCACRTPITTTWWRANALEEQCALLSRRQRPRTELNPQT